MRVVLRKLIIFLILSSTSLCAKQSKVGEVLTKFLEPVFSSLKSLLITSAVLICSIYAPSVFSIASDSSLLVAVSRAFYFGFYLALLVPLISLPVHFSKRSENSPR